MDACSVPWGAVVSMMGFLPGEVYLRSVMRMYPITRPGVNQKKTKARPVLDKGMCLGCNSPGARCCVANGEASLPRLHAWPVIACQETP